jgi:hypothetical protein
MQMDLWVGRNDGIEQVSSGEGERQTRTNTDRHGRTRGQGKENFECWILNFE